MMMMNGVEEWSTCFDIDDDDSEWYSRELYDQVSDQVTMREGNVTKETNCVVLDLSNPSINQNCGVYS